MVITIKLKEFLFGFVLLFEGFDSWLELLNSGKQSIRFSKYLFYYQLSRWYIDNLNTTKNYYYYGEPWTKYLQTGEL